jgi:hypothetical protein
MGRLKMLVLAALAAATVGIGALAIAPSASAKMPASSAFCTEIFRQIEEYSDDADYLGFWGFHKAAEDYRQASFAAANTWDILCG